MQHSSPVTGNTEHTQPEDKVFYPALDGLRAIAFFLVFAQHYIGFPWGWSGVNAFFVLSGFLITGILFDTRDDPHRAHNFYIRRTLRIFPLYYGIFILLLITTPHFHWHWSLAWIAWPLYLGNFLRFRAPAAAGSLAQRVNDAQLPIHRYPSVLYMGHFWSLCVEEQFYLFWPWLVFGCRSRRALIWLCGTVVVILPFVRVFTQNHAPRWMLDQELLYRATPFQLDSLLLGALLALLWRGSRRESLLVAARYLVGIGSGLLAAYAIYIALTCFPNFETHFRYPLWSRTWGLSLINFYSAALMLTALRPGSIVFRIFSLSGLRWVGRISYGAYVIHDTLHLAYFILVSRTIRHFHALDGVGGNTIWYIGLVFSFVATLGLAWLSFRFFESWFLNLKERWTIRTAS